jgi:hypothetical protein
MADLKAVECACSYCPKLCDVELQSGTAPDEFALPVMWSIMGREGEPQGFARCAATVCCKN